MSIRIKRRPKEGHSHAAKEVVCACDHVIVVEYRKKGPKTSPKWRTRWEAIKQERERGEAPGDAMRDNEAGASLISDRNMMCVCSAGSDDGDEETAPEDGVMVEFQTARMAEANWD